MFSNLNVATYCKMLEECYALLHAGFWADAGRQASYQTAVESMNRTWRKMGPDRSAAATADQKECELFAARLYARTVS